MSRVKVRQKNILIQKMSREPNDKAMKWNILHKDILHSTAEHVILSSTRHHHHRIVIVEVCLCLFMKIIANKKSKGRESEECVIEELHA